MPYIFKSGSRDYNHEIVSGDIIMKVSSLIGVGILLVVFGCASAEEMKETSSSGNENGSSVEVNDASLDLASYLRQVSGLTVQGSGSNAMVFIRGSQSVNSNNQPLFVVDGSRVGRTFSQVDSIVDVNDIEKVEVLKGNDASSRYGMAGSYGVVIIRTKKN